VLRHRLAGYGKLGGQRGRSRGTAGAEVFEEETTVRLGECREQFISLIEKRGRHDAPLSM
jgi:hypothetical protein